MSDYILEGQALTRYYQTGNGKKFAACLDVNLKLKSGQTLGIVGESGCGKSTLLRLLTQLERPDRGRLYFRGSDITGQRGEQLRRERRHIQMVFQDPAAAFFSRMKAGRAITQPITNYRRMTKAELLCRQKELLEMVKLPGDYADRYPHSMSGGERQRLGIARALALDPDILICDEATCALDVSVQKQMIRLLAEIQQARGLSMIFVCHDLALVQSVSHVVMVMYLGTVAEILPGAAVHQQAKHPYTRALAAAVFSLDMDFDKTLPVLDGEIPSPLDRPAGCPFHTRCPHCMPVCSREQPQLLKTGAEHYTACHLYGKQVN